MPTRQRKLRENFFKAFSEAKEKGLSTFVFSDIVYTLEEANEIIKNLYPKSKYALRHNN